MTGWFRINRRARWHFFAPWEGNDYFLVPKCGREIMYDRRHDILLKKREELPASAAGQLCIVCARREAA